MDTSPELLTLFSISHPFWRNEHETAFKPKTGTCSPMTRFSKEKAWSTSVNTWASTLSRAVLFNTEERVISKQRIVSLMWKPFPEIHIPCILNPSLRFNHRSLAGWRNSLHPSPSEHFTVCVDKSSFELLLYVGTCYTGCCEEVWEKGEAFCLEILWEHLKRQLNHVTTLLRLKSVFSGFQ